MIDAYGHHPSFCMMAAGNEPAGNWVPYTNEWVQQMKAYDPTRLYCGASVGGGWAWDDGSEYHVKAGARGLDWDKHAPSSDDDYYQQLLFPRNYKSSEPNNSPIIAHEQGQWCAFPDFKEIPQYTGAYKARNFEIFRDLLADNGMASQAEKFLQASGRLQTLCYKYEIERNLRTKDYAGFQLLGLNDLAKFPKFVYTNNERLEVPIEVYNASAAALRGAQVTWRVADHTGTLPVTTIPLGKNIQLGKVQLDLAAYQQPTKLTLQVAINGKASNQWDFWVYPNDLNCDKIQCDSLFFADTLDAKALQVLADGGDVLLTAAGKIRYGNDVKHTFLPVFWNTSWFKMRPPHTTGAYIQSNHPVFGYFPTDDWQNLNWWELTNRAQVINMAEFPADYQPIVQPLLMTTMDITRNLDRRPVARQLRYSILRYMASDDFKPAIRVAPEVIQHLFEREAPRVDMFTKESPDELKPKLN